MTAVATVMRDILADLNEKQQAAVKAVSGPVLILAGAGSGKTRVLTYRIAYLVQQKLARPEELLAVTFTNKAAREMKSRILTLTRHQSAVTVGTFHGLGARLLREQAAMGNRSVNFGICDTHDSEVLIRQALQEHGVSRREWTPSHMHHRISLAKNALRDPTQLQAQAESTVDELVSHIYARYEQLLLKNNAYDFDDLLVTPVKLLEQAPHIRVLYQQRWRFLSVDEYQDTNPLQDRWLKLLLGPEKNICVVGDDYQTIYSWRGARVDHILHFEEQFPGCQTIYLTQNYRSTPAILSTANQVIAANRQQKHKTLWTVRAPGEPVRLITLASDRQEASWIRTFIQDHLRQGGRARDIAILYRTNAQSRLFEEEFLRFQMAYTIVGGFRFYERREIKDAIAFLHLVVNPNSSLSLQRIAAALWPGIGPKTLKRWEEDATSQHTTLLDLLPKKAPQRSVIQPFISAYANNQASSFTTVADTLGHLLQKTGYLDWLKRQPDGEDRMENIEELRNVTSQYTSVPQFLEQVALMTDLDGLDEQNDRVTCMTLHAAKGLEFPQVIVVGCEEGFLPHSGSMSPAEVEEERRLLYVGITRARHQLTLTHVQYRFMHGELVPRALSRFLETMPDRVEHITIAQEGLVTQGDADESDGDERDGDASLHDFILPTGAGLETKVSPELATGDFVHHQVFGRGVVIGIAGSLLHCIFEEHGLKTLDSSKVTTENIPD